MVGNPQKQRKMLWEHQSRILSTVSEKHFFQIEAEIIEQSQSHSFWRMHNSCNKHFHNCVTMIISYLFKISGFNVHNFHVVKTFISRRCTLQLSALVLLVKKIFCYPKPPRMDQSSLSSFSYHFKIQIYLSSRCNVKVCESLITKPSISRTEMKRRCWAR